MITAFAKPTYTSHQRLALADELERMTARQEARTRPCRDTVQELLYMARRERMRLGQDMDGRRGLDTQMNEADKLPTGSFTREDRPNSERESRDRILKTSWYQAQPRPPTLWQALAGLIMGVSVLAFVAGG